MSLLWRPRVTGIWGMTGAGWERTVGQIRGFGVTRWPAMRRREYRARSWRGRVVYRLLRSPVVMFGLGPVFAMIIGPRIVAARAWRGCAPA
jgi:acyl-lipid omega-6 desaturase (Delta-12 desaturase)